MLQWEFLMHEIWYKWISSRLNEHIFCLWLYTHAFRLLIGVIRIKLWQHAWLHIQIFSKFFPAMPFRTFMLTHVHTCGSFIRVLLRHIVEGEWNSYFILIISGFELQPCCGVTALTHSDWMDCIMGNEWALQLKIIVIKCSLSARQTSFFHAQGSARTTSFCLCLLDAFRFIFLQQQMLYSAYKIKCL